ncbi:MAG: hypothetical protein ACYC9O_15590 [Candidatus Latescibacterota bacterium]
MKILIRLITCTAVFLFAVATIIKVIQGTSYKEAVGIMEEYWKEMKQSCMHCGETAPEA